MSVIAKMKIANIHDFGSGRLVELSCICENDLMAAYAESEEDKLFTKYSPWGEIKLHQPANHLLGQREDKFYIMITSKEESEPPFTGSVAFAPLRVVSITDFGDNQAKKIEMCDEGSQKIERVGVSSFNWKMSVDNPPVISQLPPSGWKYTHWMSIWPANKFNRDEAIAAAHQ